MPLIAQAASWRSTTNQDRWADKGLLESTAWSASSGTYFEIFPDTLYQVIEGFGGCFAEKGWDALSVLIPAGRDSVMRALFDSSGCNFTVCRMPIGSNDFANDYYSLNDSSDDYAMSHFNLERDKTRLIPFIKAAMAHKPDLRLWGSPWCPPKWMKTTKAYAGDGHLTQDQKTLDAYTLYLEKAITAFRAEGINITMICAQNEPTQGAAQSYPSCVWSPAEYRNFYRNYLIPRFKSDSINTELMWGTFCQGRTADYWKDWISATMDDSIIFRNINVFGFQQNVSSNGQWSMDAHNSYPEKRIYQTETECCLANDWGGGLVQFNLLSDWLNSHVNVFSEWNMILDETGKSGWGWSQASMITVNKTTKAVTYNPHFYAVKHFTNAVKPGARRIKFVNSDNSYKGTTTAFLNPNGDCIVVAGCQNSTAYSFTVKLGDKAVTASLPANSFNTFTIRQQVSNGTTVLKSKGVPLVTGIHLHKAALFLNVSSAAGMDEIECILTDLKGTVVCSGHRAGSDVPMGGLRSFAMKPDRGGIPSGAYFLNVKIKGAGFMTTVTSSTIVLIVK